MKAIKTWFKGILLSFVGGIVFFYSVVAPIELFIEMMKTTGKEFVGNFIYFCVLVLLSIFLPVIYFYISQDRAKEEESKEV